MLTTIAPPGAEAKLWPHSAPAAAAEGDGVVARAVAATTRGPLWDEVLTAMAGGELDAAAEKLAEVVEREPSPPEQGSAADESWLERLRAQSASVRIESLPEEGPQRGWSLLSRAMLALLVAGTGITVLTSAGRAAGPATGGALVTRVEKTANTGVATMAPAVTSPTLASWKATATAVAVVPATPTPRAPAAAPREAPAVEAAMAAAAPSAATSAESREARPQPDPVQAYTNRLAPRLETSRVELSRLRTQITRVKSDPVTMRDLTWLAQTTTAIGKLRTADEELQRRGTAPEALQGLDTLAAALGTELLAIADEARAQVGTGRVAELVQLTARLDASTALSQQGSTELAELR